MYDNHLSLIYYLIDNTEIDNSNAISNKEIKEKVLNDLPEYTDDSRLSLRIGNILRLVYGNALAIREREREKARYYNLKMK